MLGIFLTTQREPPWHSFSLPHIKKMVSCPFHRFRLLQPPKRFSSPFSDQCKKEHVSFVSASFSVPPVGWLASKRFHSHGNGRSHCSYFFKILSSIITSANVRRPVHSPVRTREKERIYISQVENNLSRAAGPRSTSFSNGSNSSSSTVISWSENLIFVSPSRSRNICNLRRRHKPAVRCRPSADVLYWFPFNC